MPPGATRISGFGTTVFSEFSALAAQCSAINLGQGFPDFDGPPVLLEAVERALRSGKNQYAPGHGAPELRSAIAAHAQRFYGMQVDPDTEVTVTSGATEALFDAVLALLNPGDEAVLFEPFYDSYLASIQLAGGVPRFVRLQPPDASHADWWLAPGALEAAFSPKTRLVILNTPHNPTGKVFTREELLAVGALCERFGVVLLSDEVYEHLVYPGAAHVRPATLPGLGSRTLTVSSAGKTFSFTGWKVGWAIGPPALTTALRRVHQWVTFATATPLQAAVAEALALPDAYFQTLQAEYLTRRDYLVGVLHAARLPAPAPSGSYFAVASLTARGETDDVAFCRRLTREAGVAAIPLSPFHAPGGPPPPPFARFAFCKREETLAAAALRLRRWTSGQER